MLQPVTDETFHELVRENTEPVIVLFTGSWDQFSEKFQSIVESYNETVKGDITIFAADPEKTEQTVLDLNIPYFPALALFSDGMVRDILTGFHTKNEIRLWVQENI